jgi:hypothetical protein
VYLLVPVLALGLAHTQMTAQLAASLVASYIVGIIVITAAIAVPIGLAGELVDDFEFRFGSETLAFVWAVIVIAIVGVTASQTLMPSQLTWFHALVIGALATTLAFIALVLMAQVASLLRRRLSRHARYVLPEARIITGLPALLRQAARFRSSPPDPEARSRFMNALEELADAAEHGLPRRTRTGDVATDLWFLSRAQRIAEALRGLKKLVALPVAPAKDEQPPTPFAEKRRSSWDQVVESLSECFVRAARGDWAALPQAEPTQITRPQRLTLLARFVQSVVAALIPALVLWTVIQYRGLDPATEAWAILGVSLWAVVSLLIAIDPNVESKFAFLKDLLNPLSGSKGESK